MTMWQWISLKCIVVQRFKFSYSILYDMKDYIYGIIWLYDLTIRDSNYSSQWFHTCSRCLLPVMVKSDTGGPCCHQVYSALLRPEVFCRWINGAPLTWPAPCLSICWLPWIPQPFGSLKMIDKPAVWLSNYLVLLSCNTHACFLVNGA